MSASRCASEIVLLLALGLGALAAPGPAHAEDPAEPTSFSHRMAQGRFFLKAGMTGQALSEFEAAALLPEGQAEPEVHQLLAKTRYRLGDIGGAVEAARTAAALSPRLDPEFAEFHDFLTSRFGKVLIIGGASKSAARPVPAAPLLDPELKRAFESARRDLDALGDGSTSIYLPVGSYRVGGHIVEVVAKGVARMDLRPAVDASGSGVYGERKGGERKGAERRGAVKRPTERKGTQPTPQVAPPQGGLQLRAGGAGYGQQGGGSAGARLLVGPELALLSGKLVLTASFVAGLSRAERLRGSGSAPPAGSLGGRLEVAGSFAGAGATELGPMLAWSIAGIAPFAGSLPDGYAGPTSYVVQGPEVGVRVLGPGDRARPMLAVYGFATESGPQGGSAATDRKPHLTIGAGLDVGVRLR